MLNLTLPYSRTILSLEALAKNPNHVTPVKTGVQEVLKRSVGIFSCCSPPPYLVAVKESWNRSSIYISRIRHLLSPVHSKTLCYVSNSIENMPHPQICCCLSDKPLHSFSSRLTHFSCSSIADSPEIPGQQSPHRSNLSIPKTVHGDRKIFHRSWHPRSEDIS